jgi:thioredoxin-related protein
MSKYGVQGFPTIKFTKADGSVFGEIGGYEPVDKFVADMNAAVGNGN